MRPSRADKQCKGFPWERVLESPQVTLYACRAPSVYRREVEMVGVERRERSAFGVGVIAALLSTFAMVVLRFLLGVPSLPEALADFILALLPAPPGMYRLARSKSSRERCAQLS